MLEDSSLAPNKNKMTGASMSTANKNNKDR
jgi:hypothetical protein